MLASFPSPPQGSFFTSTFPTSVYQKKVRVFTYKEFFLSWSSLSTARSWLLEELFLQPKTFSNMSNISQNGYYIYITAADPATGILTLSDNGTTNILDHGADIDSVFWVVSDNISNINAITGVAFQSGTQIFSSGPDEMTPQPGSGWKSVWGAGFIVGGSVPVNSVEEYKIFWKDTNGNDHTHDPRIIVNP